MAHLAILDRKHQIDTAAAQMAEHAAACRVTLLKGRSRLRKEIADAHQRTGGSMDEQAAKRVFSLFEHQITKVNAQLEQAAKALLEASVLVLRTGQDSDAAQSMLINSCIRFANRLPGPNDSMHAQLPPAPTGKRRGPEGGKGAAASKNAAANAAGTKPPPAAAGAITPPVAKAPGRKRGTAGPKAPGKRIRRTKKDMEAAAD